MEIGEAGAALSGERAPLRRGRGFARRMYVPRMLGLATGAICVGGGLWQARMPAWVWVVLALHALAWPHLAYRLALRSRHPYRAEMRNLMLDSGVGGAWMAVMGFNLVPSAVLAAMLAMDKAAIGGLGFLGRCLAVQAACALAVSWALGFRLELESTMVAAVAALPLLFAYPVVVGNTAYRLARRVRRQNAELAQLTSVDGLTRVVNRTHWERALAAEFYRARRIGHPSSLLMLDMDHFKALNDQHGHQAGDAALRAIGDLLREELRRHDVPGRYGGEEFGIVLPGIDAAGAGAIAERIRKRIEAHLMPERPHIRLSASIGYAALGPGDADPGAWVARADRALYAAKAAGRNCSMAASEA